MHAMSVILHHAKEEQRKTLFGVLNDLFSSAGTGF
jgi:hypothetical protein